MARVLLRKVSKRYGGSREEGALAVSDLDLEIYDRELIVLVGPSGCGKSTTLRMIAGLEDATGGEIFIGGDLVNDVPAKDRDIAMVFQNYALYPHMSVYDNMAFALKLRKFSSQEIHDRVMDAASILGIKDFLGRKPKSLSGGQCQRVALGRAIVRKPKVFLFDEPLSNLDAKLRLQMRTEIVKLHQRLQTTMVYVTHDQVEAMSMGQRIALLKDGKLQQIATPLELYHSPANIFAAGFLGSPATNFIYGTLRGDVSCLVFKEKDGGAIQLPLGVRPNAVPYIGKEVILGVRPEDCDIIPPGKTPPPHAFQGVVEIVEPMGAETFFYLRTGSHTIVSRSRTSVDRREVGHRMLFEIQPGRCYLFDPVSTLRIV